LGYQTLLLKSLRELRILADDMTKTFTSDPDCLACTTNPLGLSHTFAEYKRFSRVLGEMMSKLHVGELLAEARAVLCINYSNPDISWGDDESHNQHIFDNISYWRNSGYCGFAHVIQMSRFPVHPNLSEEDCQLFIQDRHHFLADIEEIEQRYGLSLQTPISLRGSQAFIPRELLRIPAIAEHFRSIDRADFLGRSVSHALYDAGCPVVWTREHCDLIDLLGRTGMYLACNNGDELLVNNMLQLKANVGQISFNGLTPLHLAASLGYVRICEIIWIHQNGSDVKVQDFNLYRDNTGRTPLMWAAWSGNLDTVRFFRRRSVDASLDCDFSNRTAIDLAAHRGHVQVIKYLSGCGFIIDIPDEHGRTPFWYAAARSDCDTMATLEGQGANIEHKDNQGLTPFAEAARQGQSSALDYLLSLNNRDPFDALLYESGAPQLRIDINGRDHQGKSPLILATEARKANSVRTLFEYGSTLLDTRDINVAVAIAQRNNDEETCKVLMRYARRLF
jgi:ankyrin repeat protein